MISGKAVEWSRYEICSCSGAGGEAPATPSSGCGEGAALGPGEGRSGQTGMWVVVVVEGTDGGWVCTA